MEGEKHSRIISKLISWEFALKSDSEFTFSLKRNKIKNLLKNILHPFSSQTTQTLLSNIAFFIVNLYSAENIYFLGINSQSDEKYK